MSIKALLRNPDVMSGLRKILLLAIAYAGAKYGLSAEGQAALLALFLPALQAWSHHDDGKIGAKAAADVAKLVQMPATIPDAPAGGSESRIGPLP